MVELADGFIYVEEAEEGPLSRAAAGAVIRHSDRRPPYIVVHHDVEGVLVAHWPGRVWRARVLEAVAEEDVRRHRLGARSGHETYRAAIAVEIMEEIPAWRLFGERGAAVVTILERAARLSLEGARALGEADPTEAAAAYGRAWDRWIGDRLPKGESIGGSPIRGGFSLVHQVVRNRGREVCGESAVEVDGEGEESLARPWADAETALIHTAMAYGAPQLVSREDASVMSAAWRAVFGEPPP